MFGGDKWLAWVAIGIAAALAGMIWPFRRGAIGVVVNLLAGVAGALVVAALGGLVLPQTREHDNPARLFFAALGALAALGITHAACLRRAERRRMVVSHR
ncbi:MAG: hypothetical protein ABSC94_08350 [Polyangiaceae bacterium]|jgi:uncharacterized membrane protein YeaQ/YmgE (transglycosylase-associated protein family)